MTVDHSFNSRKVVGVETKYGTIKTKHVVNCTGAWSNDIANMVRKSGAQVELSQNSLKVDQFKNPKLSLLYSKYTVLGNMAPSDDRATIDGSTYP